MEQLPLPRDIILFIKRFVIEHPLAKIMKSPKKPLKKINHYCFTDWWNNKIYINQIERWYYYDIFYIHPHVCYLCDTDENYIIRYMLRWYPKDIDDEFHL